MKIKLIILACSAYLLTTTILFNVFNIPSINIFISAFIASVNFLAIPTLIGIVFIIFFLIQQNTKHESTPLMLITCWIGGALFILIVALSFLIANIFQQILFTSSCIILLIINVIFLLFCIKNEYQVNIRKLFSPKYLMGILLALIPLIIFKTLTGFPGNYSVVGYKFTYISEAMVQRDTLILDQLTSYVPISQVVLSIVSTLYNLDTYGLSWFAVFIVNILLFLGIYTFLSLYFHDEKLALLGATVSSYVLVWDPYYFNPPLHDLQPRVLAFITFPYLLSSLIYSQKTTYSIKKYMINLVFTFLTSVIVFLIMRSMLHPELVNRKLIIIPAIISVLYSFLLGYTNKSNGLIWFTTSLLMTSLPIIHIFEGICYVFVAFCFALSVAISSKYPKIFGILAYVSTCLLFVILFLMINNIVKVESFQLPSFVAAPTYYGYTFLPRMFYDVLVNAISPTIFYLMFMGIGVGLFRKAIYDRIWIASLIAVYFVIMTYFMPIPDIVRIGAALAPFIPLFVFYGLRETLYFLLNIVKKYTYKVKSCATNDATKALKKIYICLILAVVVPSLLSPFQNYVMAKASLMQGIGNLSLVTDYEYTTALWIRKNTPKYATIISDPETMYILAGMSGRSLPIVLGMTVRDLQIPDLVKLYWIKFNILATNDSYKVAFYATLLGRYPIIVISGRTISWLNSLEFVSKPQSYISSSHPILTKFLDGNGPFKLLYKIDGKIYVFTVENVTNQECNYDIFLVNYFSNYDNATNYAEDWRNSTQRWYLSRQVISDIVTIVYEQYVSNGGNPSIIKWNIPISNNYDQVDVYVYNLSPLNRDDEAWFSLSVDGKNWISDNFSYPLKYVLSVKPHDGFITLYGKGVDGKFTRIGTFIFVGWTFKFS